MRYNSAVFITHFLELMCPCATAFRVRIRQLSAVAKMFSQASLSFGRCSHRERCDPHIPAAAVRVLFYVSTHAGFEGKIVTWEGCV